MKMLEKVRAKRAILESRPCLRLEEAQDFVVASQLQQRMLRNEEMARDCMDPCAVLYCMYIIKSNKEISSFYIL